MRNLQFEDQDDLLSVLVDLMQVDDVSVFHLCQDVDLLLDVFPCHSTPRRLQTFLFNVFGRIFVTGGLLYHSEYCCKLTAAKSFFKLLRRKFQLT